MSAWGEVAVPLPLEVEDVTGQRDAMYSAHIRHHGGCDRCLHWVVRRL